MAGKRRRLGELLIEAGVIDALQLNAALGHQRQWGVPLGRALVEKRFVTEEQILAALSSQTGVPVLRIDLHKLDKALAQLLPLRIAEQERAVPLRLEGARGEILVVALGGPANLASLDHVRGATGKTRVIPYLAKDSEIDRALGILYRGEEVPAEAPSRGANFESLPEPGAHVQGEAEFEFGGPEGEADDPMAGLMGNSGVADSGPRPIAVIEGVAEASGPGVQSALDAALDAAMEGSRQAPAPPPSAPVEANTVLIFGWPPQAAELLRHTLLEGGIASQVVAPGAPLSASQLDVVIAPLPVIEALTAARQAPLSANVIVAVKSPESDLHRAQKVGAKGYLATPVDNELLLRAVRRCLRR